MEGMAMPSAESAVPSMTMAPSSMPGMSMASTFSTSTRVTVFFAEWTTNSTAAYIGTIFFLFFLAIFNRFLGALKIQLENSWSHGGQEHPSTGSRRKTTASTRHGSWIDVKRGSHTKYLTEDRDPEAEPLSPLPVEPSDDAGHRDRNPSSIVDTKPRRGGYLPWRWESSGPWQWNIDGIRALLEFMRAFIGYLLMLAVMTFNVGFLFAVLGGVLFGELFLGRYARGSPGWQEGGCHE